MKDCQSMSRGEVAESVEIKNRRTASCLSRLMAATHYIITHTHTQYNRGRSAVVSCLAGVVVSTLNNEAQMGVHTLRFSHRFWL